MTQFRIMLALVIFMLAAPCFARLGDGEVWVWETPAGAIGLYSVDGNATHILVCDVELCIVAYPVRTTRNTIIELLVGAAILTAVLVALLS